MYCNRMKYICLLFLDYYNNDFALMELEADILENDYTGKIATCDLRQDTEWPTEGDTGYVHGWGCTQAGKWQWWRHSLIWW